MMFSKFKIVNLSNLKVFKRMLKIDTVLNAAKKGSTPKTWFNNLEEGLVFARSNKKPAMIIVHRDWCKACEVLLPKIISSPEIERLSVKLAIIKISKDDEPEDAKYAPDGQYVPRIIFTDWSANVLKDIVNESNFTGTFNYSYRDLSDIINSMNKVLKEYNKQN